MNKKYKCGVFTYSLPETACVFCKHCNSVLWDYSDGIYCIVCEVDEKLVVATNGNINNKCPHFESEV